MINCKICNNLIDKYYIDNNAYFYCPNCEGLFKERILDDFNEKKRYDFHIVDNNYIIYMNKFFHSIKSYLLPGLSLDFGCGKIKALEYIFVSNNLKMYSYDKYYVDFNYKDYKYDNIILNEVFEHIKEPYKLLEELKMLLNPGGRIIIGTNLHNNNFNNWWYLRDSTHISFYSIKTFKILALKLNLKIIDIKSNLIILES